MIRKSSHLKPLVRPQNLLKLNLNQRNHKSMLLRYRFKDSNHALVALEEDCAPVVMVVAGIIILQGLHHAQLAEVWEDVLYVQEGVVNIIPNMKQGLNTINFFTCRDKIHMR